MAPPTNESNDIVNGVTTTAPNPGTVTSTITTVISTDTSTTSSITSPITSNSINSDPHHLRIDRVAIKPPPFWKSSPKLWFSHLEAQFVTGSIVSDETKYYYVVAALDEHMLKLVSDIVEKPPKQNKYQIIRDSLIQILSESEAQRLQKLLKGMELGDQKPSQLLRQMRSSNDFALLDPVLKNLWLQRLPQQAQIVLAASTGSLDDLALLADKILETFNPPTLFGISNQNQEVSSSSNFTTLEAKLDEFFKHISLVDRSNSNSARNRSSSRTFVPRNRSGSPRPSQGSDTSGNTKDYKYCWYHFRFGADATKCVSPCQFKSSKN